MRRARRFGIGFCWPGEAASVPQLTREQFDARAETALASIGANDAPTLSRTCWVSGPRARYKLRQASREQPYHRAMNRTATCACGDASITVSEEPKLHGVCHCTNCKRRTGSAFGISAYFERTAVVEQKGQTNVYAFHHTECNHDQERHFCVHCGTTLFWFVSNMPDKIGIAGGCFAPSGLPEPNGSYRHSKREPWVTLPSHWHVSND